MQPSVSSIGQQALLATDTSAEQVQASVPSPMPSVPQPEDLYTYQKCTIMIVVQLRPQVEDGCARPVLLSVQNGTANTEDLPLYRLLSSEDELGGPFPPALVSLLEELQRELPTRKQRHKQRVTKQSTAASASTRAVQKPPPALAKDAGKLKKAVASIQSTPPVSAPATPLPKEGLVLGGLFDNL
jgi:hypothetical protein